MTLKFGLLHVLYLATCIPLTFMTGKALGGEINFGLGEKVVLLNSGIRTYRILYIF